MESTALNCDSEFCPELKCQHQTDNDLARHTREPVNAYFCYQCHLLQAEEGFPFRKMIYFGFKPSNSGEKKLVFVHQTVSQLLPLYIDVPLCREFLDTGVINWVFFCSHLIEVSRWQRRQVQVLQDEFNRGFHSRRVVICSETKRSSSLLESCPQRRRALLIYMLVLLPSAIFEFAITARICFLM